MSKAEIDPRILDKFAEAASDWNFSKMSKQELLCLYRNIEGAYDALLTDGRKGPVLEAMNRDYTAWKHGWFSSETTEEPDTHEVNIGFGLQKSIHKAAECLVCGTSPCVTGKIEWLTENVGGCPVLIDIPAFLALVREGKILEAWKKIMEKDSIPAITGRVCPQEVQCQVSCSIAIKDEPVEIGRLERFVADYVWEHHPEEVMAHIKSMKEKRGKPENAKHHVAVIGAGPAGLTVAADLAILGYEVTIFEALHVTGGVLAYGIPKFRLPAHVLEREISIVTALGVNILHNITIGRSITIKDIFEEGFDAVFIGTGAGLPRMMGIPGENLNGVYSANEFLVRLNLMHAYKDEAETPVRVGTDALIVGGGFTAIDAARWAKRLNHGNVTIIYRRSREEMPARVEEVENALQEGVKLMLLVAPVEIIGDGKGGVSRVKCIQMKLGEPDESGRRRPIPVEGSEFEIPAQTVITALGTTPNPIILHTTEGLKGTKWGTVEVKSMETGETSLPATYAGGDVVTGAATVILAMGAGKKAAAAIDKVVQEKKPSPERLARSLALVKACSEPFEILSHRRLVPDIYEMVVKAKFVAKYCSAGQFVMVMKNMGSERIPLTIADWDREKGTITLVYQVVGKGTAELEKMKVGDHFLGIPGPLGKKSVIEKHPGPVLMVAGGVGLAAIYPILRTHVQTGNDVTLIYGARSKDYLFWMDKLAKLLPGEQLIVTTDDGSYGEKGLVTEAMKRHFIGKKGVSFSVIIGPAIMMRESSKLTIGENIPTIVSLNPLMLDGTAMCGGCRCAERAEGGKVAKAEFACHSGPDREAKEVDLDNLMARQLIYRNEEKEIIAFGIMNELKARAAAELVSQS
jgi:glutamate synthase (NADPH/NADH) small chain